MWIFKFLNSNMIHNFLNIVIAFNGILLWAGCDYNEAGQAVCAQEWIPPEVAVILIGSSGIVKIVMNLVRDGLPGLIKQQPPVVSEITKTEVTVKPVAKK